MEEHTSELVRISAKGEAHPIGTVAAERMREREGTFRVLPAPPHVVFMRLTGEDGRRDEEDGAVVRLAGEVTAPGAICDIIAMMVHTRWRGELQIRSSEGRRSIFMESGNVVGGSTNVDDERIGQVMWRYGGINQEEHGRIMAQVKKGARFGSAAVALGILTRDVVYYYVGRQIEQIVFGALEVDDGTFFFLDGFDSERLVSHHTINASMLLMDGVTRLDEIKYFRQRIPNSNFIPADGGATGPPPQEFEAVYDAVDGVRNVADIGRQTGLGEFECTKALYALSQSKYIIINKPRFEGGLSGLVDQGNHALRPIYQRVDAAGKGTAFRNALDQFATGAGIYAMLFRGAGPNERGMLEPDGVCQNLHDVADGDEELFLKTKLHEYISFALFAAGGVLGADVEGILGVEVAPIMTELMPSG
jgi:hypothetical protein